MDLDDVTMRAPSPGDVPRIAAVVAEGFETYRSFAPAGWTPPPIAEHESYLAARLWDPGTWATLAERGDALAGVVSMVPAATSRRPVADPRLAHLWQLFVAREWWGSGLATRLHRLVVEAARTRGFTAMRSSRRPTRPARGASTSARAGGSRPPRRTTRSDSPSSSTGST
jgi:GNAT superfamily N-acetyltransferase